MFRESCSKYVYRITKQNGFVEGLKALKERVNVCKPPYMVYKRENNFEMHLGDGSILQQNEISLELLPPNSYRYKNIIIDK